MNTITNNEACLSIKAKHIGPIMELDGKLSPKGQNLLFATSGTGKSFISRALRALDGPVGEGEKDIDPADVVSEEGSNGVLSLLEGTAEITKIAFDKTFGRITRSPSQYIFHVFSSDYVGAELASRSYVLDGETFTRGPGQAVFVPRGREHTFRVVGGAPSRSIVILTPGGFEGFFREMALGRFRIPEDMPAVMESAARFQLTFTGPPLGIQ